MTNEQKLKKIIERAVDGGWTAKKRWFQSITDTIFSHDFAIAFWGEALNAIWTSDSNPAVPEWQDHLQQLATTPEKERIDYLYKFLKHD